jgi:hypothetical protein
MTNALRITLACDVIGIHVDTLKWALQSRLGGPLAAMDDAIKTDGFLHPMTIEAARVRTAVKELRGLAESIEQRMVALQNNEKKCRLQAAE